jgi:hypothetical protein
MYYPVLADLYNLDPRFRSRIQVLSWEEGKQVIPRREGGCWEWTGYRNWSGAKKTVPYGRIRIPGAGYRASAVYVHRYVYELFWGRIPEGFETHHSCEYTLCCHPMHIHALDPDEHDEIHDHTRNFGMYARGKR